MRIEAFCLRLGLEIAGLYHRYTVGPVSSTFETVASRPIRCKMILNSKQRLSKGEP